MAAITSSKLIAEASLLQIYRRYLSFMTKTEIDLSGMRREYTGKWTSSSPVRNETSTSLQIYKALLLQDDLPASQWTTLMT